MADDSLQPEAIDAALSVFKDPKMESAIWCGRGHLPYLRMRFGSVRHSYPDFYRSAFRFCDRCLAEEWAGSLVLNPERQSAV